MNKRYSPFQGIEKKFVIALFAGLLALSDAAFAFVNNGFFPFDLADEPDTSSGLITVTYDADGVDMFTGLLSAKGFASQLRANGGMIYPFDLPGQFSLSVNINNSTGEAISGVFDINGTIAALGFNSGDFLTGVLTAFGSEAGSESLQFIFDLTSGDAVSLYGGTAGIILSTTGIANPPGGDPAIAFASDFSNESPVGVANTAAVPIPAAFWLFVSGVGLVIARNRRV